MSRIDEKLQRVLIAEGEELWSLIRDPHPDIILNATANRNLTEEMAVYILKKKTIPSEIPGILAGDIRFKDSYKLKVYICRHPKTPQKITLSLLKFIRVFDLGEMTKDQGVPVSTRQKIEYLLIEKIPSMPSGVKLALSKRSSSTVVAALIERGDARVVSGCLDSPSLTEGHLLKIIAKAEAKPVVVRSISEHPKWSLRQSLRYALVRHQLTPLSLADRFISEMKTQDLRELYADNTLPSSTRPFIFRELFARGETTDPPKDEAFDIPEDEDNLFP